MKAIVLVGFMGSGKTEVGKILAERLGVPFLDLDREIERLEGKSVGQIFSEMGEAHFRKREREVLQTLTGGNMVLAIGGGAFTADDNIALINAKATTVWLNCPLAVCMERCARKPGQRPIFSEPEEMARIFEHRKRFYGKAHFTVDSGTGEPEDVAERILELPGIKPAQDQTS
jgi:shikimate kinase